MTTEQGFQTTITEEETDAHGRKFLAIYLAHGSYRAPRKGRLIGYEEITDGQNVVQEKISSVLAEDGRNGNGKHPTPP